MLATAFHHDLPLPLGHHTIEASAGTGKTFALVGLAARYLAEGRTTASGLLLVTFSRASTRELRSRLLNRLGRADRLLQQALRGQDLDGTDAVDDALLAGDSSQVALRAERIRHALRDLDTATVTTIHGLCAELLQRTGEGLDTELADGDDLLINRLMADVFHRLVRSSPDVVDLLPEEQVGRQIISAALSVPRSSLMPDCHVEWLGTSTGVNGCIAKAASLGAEEHRRDARVHSYDDLLRMLDERLGGAAGAAAVDPSRPLFTVGLVDEFQDTDPVQWSILQKLFPDNSGADGRSLVMVADPKQSIYGFRGADVATYLRVRGERPDHTLGQNFRADPPVVRAGTVLFSDCDLGQDISVHEVTAEQQVRLSPTTPAIHLRVVTDAAPTPRNRSGRHLAEPTREYIAADVAGHAVELLHGGFELTLQDEQPRPLKPSDITVLVRTNAQAAMVQRQLGLRGLPSVLNGVGNVLKTRAARDWLTLLRALHQPSRGAPARLAALTDLMDGSVQSVSAADEGQMDQLHILLHELAAILEAHGVAALLRALDDQGMTSRLVAASDGPRRLVDLQHVGELIHGRARAVGSAPAGLITWLEQSMATASDTPPELHARRLADAGDAVEVMTAHSAKGLERGVVLAPYLWDPPRFRPEVIRYIDDSGRRWVDVGGDDRRAPEVHAATRGARMASARLEHRREEMRLAYVAVTRARHHVVLWWGSANEAASSPLAEMLGCSGGSRGNTHKALKGAQQLAAEYPDLFLATPVEHTPDPIPWHSPGQQPAVDVPIRLATLDRTIDHGWRRTSYSGLMRKADEIAAARGTDRADPGATDEVLPAAADIAEDDDGAQPHVPHQTSASAGHSTSAEVPLSTMPGGAEVGSAIHSVLEHADFMAQDLSAHLDPLLTTHLRGTSVDLEDPAMRELVLDGLTRAIRTPLGPHVGDIRLADLPRGGRFDELAFELPVLSGALASRPGELTMSHVADLLDQHLSADDPLVGYAEHLRASHAQIEMRGYLTGFIDLLARVPAAASSQAGQAVPQRYLVADYKTNRLGDGSDPVLRVDHHDLASMTDAMIHHHYPIQAMLYLVATHRFLRWRVPDYRLERDLVGAAYLFVRGMTGADGGRQPDGTPHGVFLWRPPAALVDDLDRLLAGGPEAVRGPRAVGGADA